MDNEEKFDKKVVYDEKGDYEVMENKTENAKPKKTLGDKLGKKVEESKTAPSSTGATPLGLTPKAEPTTPLEELDLKNPTTKVGTTTTELKPTPKPVATEPLKPEVTAEPPKADSKPEVKPEPPKADPKPEVKVEPPKADPKPEVKTEPPKVDLKPEVKPVTAEPPKVDLKPQVKTEPAKVDPKPEVKPEPPKADPKPEVKAEPAKEDPKPEPPKADSKEGLSKLSLGAKLAETPKVEEAPKAEPPKEEPKEETISPFVLHPLAELCSKFSYNDSSFIAAVRRNLSVLASNPQERFYADGYKALIIHGARLLDDNGNLLIHIETAEHGHAIVKITQSGYQDCTGTMTVGDIIMANVGGKDLCICSMAFSPKLRFMK